MIDTKFESWKNVGQGRIYILRQDRLTGLSKHELVNAGRTFQISKEERQLNQENAANDDLDIFANGMLVPVRLLEGDEESEALATNPQYLAESELGSLFDLHWKQFEKRVSELRSPVTLDRLKDAGKERDATVKQMAVIEARLAELLPDHELHTEPVDVGPRLTDGAGFKPVSP